MFDRNMFIHVYRGDGAEKANVVVESLVSALKYLREKYPQVSGLEVKTIDAFDVLAGNWMNESKLFVLPGGRDLPYVACLNGKGNENIRQFVLRGGSFLGLCAGAYYCSSYVQFESGTPLEVIGERELGFYPGIAKGSVYPKFSYEKAVSASVVALSMTVHNFPFLKMLGNTSHAYFNGGCEFIPSSSGGEEVDVLAEYADYPGKSAVVFMRKGRGKVLLSGVHPEMDPTFMNQDDYNPQLWSDMTRLASSQRYEIKEVMGNGMNKVLPGLFIGNFRDAKDMQQIEANGITHIVAVHDNAQPCFDHIQYKCVDISDTPGQSISKHFVECIEFIHEARVNGGGVLVHCIAGVSRSTTITAAYLITITMLGWEEAVSAIRAAREIVNPNYGFQQQLQNFEVLDAYKIREKLLRKYQTFDKADEDYVRELLKSSDGNLSGALDANLSLGTTPTFGDYEQKRRAGSRNKETP